MNRGAWQAAVRGLVRQGQPYCFKWRMTRVGEDVEPPEPSYAAYAGVQRVHLGNQCSICSKC